MTIADFVRIPFVARIAEKARWTVSTGRKMPVDMRALMATGQIHGAKANNETCLASLPEIVAYFDNISSEAGQPVSPSNVTLYVNSFLDGFVMLDIEPDCPEDIKAELLKIPCLYAERSMSGKGIHMIFREPTRVLELFPQARKRAVREEHGWYEILLDHYATFTMNDIPWTPADVDAPPDPAFVRLFTDLAKVQRASAGSYAVDAEAERVMTAELSDGLRDVADAVIEGTELLDKDKYCNDLSRWEFACLLKLTTKVKIEAYKKQVKLDDEATMAVLWAVASEVIPYRPKHDEKRGGMPLLLYTCYRAYEKYMSEETEKTMRLERALDTVTGRQTITPRGAKFFGVRAI